VENCKERRRSFRRLAANGLRALIDKAQDERDPEPVIEIFNQ
jgi:hypothetical protein